MNKFNRVLLALPLMALAILPARAQVTIDVSKITCEQYVLFTVADPRDIAMWLSGYFNSKTNNTLLDTQKFREHARQVMDYCQQNFKTPVMEAAEKVLGLEIAFGLRDRCSRHQPGDRARPRSLRQCRRGGDWASRQ